MDHVNDDEHFVNIANLHNMNDEDFRNNVDEFFDENGMEIDNIIQENEMEIDNIQENGDEDHVLSADSDCISDCSDNFTGIYRKVVKDSQLNSLNGRTKHCAIYCYYSTGGALAVCASCMIELAGEPLGGMYLTRRHVTDTHDAIDGRYCSDCRHPLFVIFPCNMCPMCTL